MDEKHRSILRDLRLNIMKDLEPKCILPHLGRVFSETEEEEIRAQSTRQERCVTLLEILPRKGPLAFAAFVAALKKEANHLAVELIEEDKKHIEKKFIGVRAQSAKLVRVITNLNAELDTQERSIETLEGVESDIVARHSNTRDLTEIPLQRDELKKQCESLAKHLEETHLVVSNLKKRLTTTFQDRATSTRDLEEFERTERRTEDDLCLAREHSEKLQGEIHQLKTEADKQDHIKTSQELEELKSRHEIAKAQTLQLADLVQQLRDERDSAARENQTSEKEIQEWKTKSEKYEQENQALQKSLESAMEIQEKLKLLSSDLETANKEQQEQIRQLQRMNEHKKGLEEGQDVEKLEKQRTTTLQDKATSPRELKCKEGTSSDEHTLPKLQGMNTNRVVKIQRSEQQVSSGSSQTHSESSVHTSKINEEEKALTSERNKQYLGEIGETLINLIITAPHLTKEQQTAVYRMLAVQVQTYQEYQDHSTDKQKGVGALTESIIGTYGILLESFKISSMEQERKKKKK